MNKKIRVAAVVAALALMGAGLAACAPANKGVIQLGAICDTTGPVQFPDSCAAANAYFQQVNKNGGINGYTFKYNQMDGGGSAATTATAAQRLVNSNGVVAFVGGSGTNACTATTELLKSKGIYDLQGFAADDGCWASSNAMPVNTGGTMGYFAVLNSLFTGPNNAKVCVMIPNVPTINNTRAVIAAYEKSSGNKITSELLWVPGGDLTPIVATAKAKGCTGVGLIGIEPVYVGVLRAAQAQQAFTASQATTFSTGYTDSLAKALGDIGQGLTASSEMLPYSSDSADLKEFKELQATYKFNLSVMAEAGYLAAKIFVERVKSISGDVTAKSIGEALTSAKDVSTGGLTADPFTWGTFNVASQYVTLKDGAWTQSSTDWYRPSLTNDEVKALVSGK